MHGHFQTILLTMAILLLVGCSEGQRAADDDTVAAEQPPEAQPYVVEIRAVGKTFEAPSQIPSGWTTFKFINASSMLHFAIIDVPPEGVTAQVMNDSVMQPFQDAMDAMNAGDQDAVNAAFGEFPAWIGELSRAGGPGFLSAGHSGQTTVFLKPGNYILECYIKSDGIFHSTSPGGGQLGMIMDLTVTEEENGAREPKADVTLEVRNSGIELVSGELRPGTNTVRVNFVEQQALPSFVGNDVHLMRATDPDSISRTSGWMDWRKKNGLEDPGPAEFLGGINDLPAGEHGYFTADLSPGSYAFIAEMPDPRAAGFVLPFEVGPDR